MNFIDEVSEFARHDLFAVVSSQLVSVLNGESLNAQNLAELDVSLLEEKIMEFENLLSATQEIINEKLKAKLPAILDVFNSNEQQFQSSTHSRLFYLDFINKLNNAVNGLNEYKNLSLQVANANLVSQISNNESAAGFDLAIKHKNDEGVVGGSSRERIRFEFNNFVQKHEELLNLLMKNRNVDGIDFNIKHVFVKKGENWFVTNNLEQIEQFISETILSSTDDAIAKCLSKAVEPYLYNSVEILPSGNPFKDVIISSSQSLLALSKSLTYLTDLHFRIKSLDRYLLDGENYISNRLMKWLNLLITSLVWESENLYDIFYMGLFVLFFVKLRSFFLPELRSTIGHILSLSRDNESNITSEDTTGYCEEWSDKLGKGAEYQPNPYKGWTPGKPFKGVDIPQNTALSEFRRLINSLRILIENTK